MIQKYLNTRPTCQGSTVITDLLMLCLSLNLTPRLSLFDRSMNFPGLGKIMFLGIATLRKAQTFTAAVVAEEQIRCNDQGVAMHLVQHSNNEVRSTMFKWEEQIFEVECVSFH